MVSSERLLEIWEAGLQRPPLVRALAVMRAAGLERAGEDLARLPMGVRDLLLLGLREETFGAEVNGLSRCPECGEDVEMHFRADDIRLPAAEVPEALRLERDGYALEFRLPTTEDLLNADLVGDEEADEQQIFRRCISAASCEGRSVTADELPEAVQEAVAGLMAQHDPQADVEIALSCPRCGVGWQEVFDIELFFWTELQAWASRMLREIHQLACAYGWSEREILGLSPLRRSIYLNFVAE